MTNDLEIFLEVLDRAFIDPDVKADLKTKANQGVTPELWGKMNEYLIEELNHCQHTQQQSSAQLDEEIIRYTTEYEEEKTVLDRKMMDELKALPEDDEPDREALWDIYRRHISQLQQQLAIEIRKTSHTILGHVVLAVATPPHSPF